MRLRRSRLEEPGITRVRRGTGFAYRDPSGGRVDAQTRERVQALAVPPAWVDVWICPHANGHIQAVGTDAAGRRQYLYHEDWHRTRGREKHDRVLRLAARLPEARREVSRRLGRRGSTRERVAAVALRLLDAGLFRTGGEEYEAEHGSHGVATLLREHVRVTGDVVSFTFPAKSGVLREAEVRDRALAKAVRSLLRSPGPSERLLQYLDTTGWHDLTSTDVNREFKDLVGEAYTVKDLRTWAATVLAAAALADDAGPAAGSEKEVLRLVAEHLGNTPAVAKRSYVDGRVLDEHAAGRTVARALGRVSGADLRRLRTGDLGEVRDRASLERAVVRLLT